MIQVSIIIPHYNSADLLKKLLLSIPNYQDIEIIVVDDNTTQGQEKLNNIVNDKDFNHVNFLRNNTGIQSAGTCRNIGIDVAKGKWILFADADDYFIKGFYSIIQKYFNTKYDIVFFNPSSVYIDTKQVSNRHIKYRNLIFNYMNDKTIENETKLRYEHGTPWSKLIKKSLIDSKQIKFDEVLAWNDKLFSTKIGFYMERFSVSPEIIYCITRSQGSLTTTISSEVLDSRIDVFIRYFKFIDENLPQSKKKHLPLTGIGKLIMVQKSRLGLFKVYETYKKFKKNDVKILDKKFFNPIYILKKSYSFLQNYRKEQGYYYRK